MTTILRVHRGKTYSFGSATLKLIGFNKKDTCAFIEITPLIMQQTLFKTVILGISVEKTHTETEEEWIDRLMLAFIDLEQEDDEALRRQHEKEEELVAFKCHIKVLKRRKKHDNSKKIDVLIQRARARMMRILADDYTDISDLDDYLKEEDL